MGTKGLIVAALVGAAALGTGGYYATTAVTSAIRETKAPVATAQSTDMDRLNGRLKIIEEDLGRMMMRGTGMRRRPTTFTILDDWHNKKPWTTLANLPQRYISRLQTGNYVEYILKKKDGSIERKLFTPKDLTTENRRKGKAGASAAANGTSTKLTQTKKDLKIAKEDLKKAQDKLTEALKKNKTIPGLMTWNKKLRNKLALTTMYPGFAVLDNDLKNNKYKLQTINAHDKLTDKNYELLKPHKFFKNGFVSDLKLLYKNPESFATLTELEDWGYMQTDPAKLCKYTDSGFGQKVLQKLYHEKNFRAMQIYVKWKDPAKKETAKDVVHLYHLKSGPLAVSVRKYFMTTIKQPAQPGKQLSAAQKSAAVDNKIAQYALAIRHNLSTVRALRALGVGSHGMVEMTFNGRKGIFSTVLNSGRPDLLEKNEYRHMWNNKLFATADLNNDKYFDKSELENLVTRGDKLAKELVKPTTNP